MMKTLLLVPLLALLAAACTSEKSEVPEETTPPAEAPVQVDAQVHNAKCGCALPDVGKCGNYIEVDGEFVVLEHPSLGAMDYCGKGDAGAQVKVTGEMVDGKYVAASYEVMP